MLQIRKSFKNTFYLQHFNPFFYIEGIKEKYIFFVFALNQ